MFDWLTYEHIKDFQGLIVGAFGFGGVIWTLRQNARLTRQQHERGIQHERALITRALLAELRRNRESLADNLARFQRLEEGAGLMMPLRTITELYEKNFDRVAHLNEDQLRHALDAYSKIKAIPDRVMFALSMSLSQDQIEIRHQYLFVHPGIVGLYRTLVQNAVEAIDTAIFSLEAARPPVQ